MKLLQCWRNAAANPAYRFRLSSYLHIILKAPATCCVGRSQLQPCGRSARGRSVSSSSSKRLPGSHQGWHTLLARPYTVFVHTGNRHPVLAGPSPLPNSSSLYLQRNLLITKLEESPLEFDSLKDG